MIRSILRFAQAALLACAASAWAQAPTGKTEVLWLGQAAFRITTPGGKVIVWKNPATGKDEAHYGANPLGKGTPAEYIKALGDTTTRVIPLKPGEKVVF